MLHHITTISVCYGGHFESKMTAKLQKSSDLGKIWYYYRHDRVKNWALIISCCVLTLFFIHTTNTCIVHLGDITVTNIWSLGWVNVGYWCLGWVNVVYWCLGWVNVGYWCLGWVNVGYLCLGWVNVDYWCLL